MKTYAVEFRVSVPDDVTDDQAREWVRFNLRDKCDMQNSNPMSSKDLEPLAGTFVMRPM